MRSEYTKILEFNQYQKSDKAPFIIYADLECIIQKIDARKNNTEYSSANKVSKYIHRVFQSLEYLHLEEWKIGMMFTELKIVSKSFVNP